MHFAPEQPRIQTEVLGHSLIRSFVCLFVCSFAHSLTLSQARGKVNDKLSQHQAGLNHCALAVVPVKALIY